METQVAESLVSEILKAYGIPILEFMELIVPPIVTSIYYNEGLSNGLFDMTTDFERFRTEKCRTCKNRIVEDNCSYCNITTDKRYKNGLHRVKARRETCFCWKQK